MKTSLKKRRLAALEKKSTSLTSDSPHGGGSRRDSPRAGLPSKVSAVPRNSHPASSRSSVLRRGGGRSRQASEKDGPPAGPEAQAHQLYNSLCADSLLGPSAAALELDGARTAGEDFPVKMLQDLMATSRRQFNSAEAIESKVRDQMLMLDNPSKQQSAHGRQRENQNARTLVRKLKSASQLKKTNTDSVHREHASYSNFVGLNEKWNQYFSRLMDQSPRDFQEALASSTFLGCQLKVIQSRRVQCVGLHGIVIRDSPVTFQIVTRADRIKVLPKRGSIFESVGLPWGQRVRIHGDMLSQRSA